MFTTKLFTAGDIERGLLDGWLNSLNTNEQGMMVVGYGTFPETETNVSELSVTVKMWKRTAMDSLGRSMRTTIDEIPEDPTIQVDEEI